ncbi:MAG: c-type cytochrome [Burkholderiales bacterium]
MTRKMFEVTRLRFVLPVMLALAGPVAWAQSSADAARSLAESKRCLVCHKMEEKSMGPSVRDIAAKYKGAAGAQAAVMARMRGGSKGIWGNVPMAPVNKDISEEDLKTMVAWMLSPGPK